MKYSMRGDLVDPKERIGPPEPAQKRSGDLVDPAPRIAPLEFDFEDDDHSEIRDDAYVIGEHGDSINEPDVKPARDAEEPKRWVKPAAIVLTVVCIALTGWNASRVIQGPPPPKKPTPVQSKQALYLGVMKIDAYQRLHGSIPDSLSDVGLPEGGIYAYTRQSPTRYLLSFQGNGAKLEYDSSEPKEQFFGSPQDMLTIGESK